VSTNFRNIGEEKKRRKIAEGKRIDRMGEVDNKERRGQGRDVI
jgi:hypothetical protein